MSRILPLPADAVSQIHSSKHITSLQGVVLSLLDNSLDAGSNKIEVTIDFRRGSSTVEDDGQGIPLVEVLEHGGLAKMYHTSKQGLTSKHELHGTTGTHLASLAALSFLSITSRHSEQEEHATLTIHRGEVIARQAPAPPAHELSLSSSHGTRVTVRDLFGNMPVRVKQRASIGDAGNPDEKAWSELKRGVVALMLAWPRPCSIRIRDINHGGRALHLSGQHPAVSAALTEKSLNRLRGKEMKFELKDALPILLQAGLAPAGSRNRWVPVSASTVRFSIKGFICLDPAPTRQCQFISVGIHPCPMRSGQNDLYDAVNKVFSNSSFGSIEDDSDLDEAEKDRRKRDRRYKSNGYTQKQLQGRKGVDRWPMFVLQIKCKDQRSSSTAESMSESSLKGIVEVLEATATQWLTANHFRPRKCKQRKNQDQQSPAVASTQRSSSAGPTPSSRLRPSALATTRTPKRTATSHSATTSKKRRIMDVHGKSHLLDGIEGPIMHSQNGYFSTWSRIKSGSAIFYDDIWQGRRSATAPARQCGSAISPPARPKRSVFKFPTLEAGELTVGERFANKATVTPLISDATEVGYTGDEEVLSDAFGSVDDDALLAALKKMERSAGPQTHSNEILDDSEVPADADSNLSNDQVLDWIDPVTKQAYKVNARTGVVLPMRPKLTTTASLPKLPDGTTPARHTAAINTSVSSASKSLLSKRRINSTPAHSEPRWLPGFLKEWNNPVFVRQDQERIPVASLDGPGIDTAEVATKRCTHDARTSAFAEVGAAGTSKLSKAALRDARVIRQVDQKFVLCKMKTSRNDTDGEVLVLIDQHAASERIILEGLLDQLCEDPRASASGGLSSRSTGYGSSVKTTHVEKPLRFQISATEYRLFHTHAQHFANWGILYELLEKDEVVTASQVRAPKQEYVIAVTALPPGIAERCTLVPKLLIELLRSEVWSVAESATIRAESRQYDQCRETEDKADGQKHPWLKRLGSCPKGILEMLNSRACRSAIMFNDELSLAQCQDLVTGLSTCAFPFICAHGRVSMVPLVELGNEDDAAGSTGGFFVVNEENTAKSFPMAFTEFIHDIRNR